MQLALYKGSISRSKIRKDTGWFRQASKYDASVTEMRFKLQIYLLNGLNMTGQQCSLCDLKQQQYQHPWEYNQQPISALGHSKAAQVSWNPEEQKSTVDMKDKPQALIWFIQTGKPMKIKIGRELAIYLTKSYKNWNYRQKTAIFSHLMIGIENNTITAITNSNSSKMCCQRHYHEACPSNSKPSYSLRVIIWKTTYIKLTEEYKYLHQK